VTARKTKSEQDEKTTDETKTAGEDKSATDETTKQAAEREVPTTAEKRGETDAEGAATGSVEGGVVDGDSNALDEDDTTFSDDGASIEGADGTVAEKDRDGNEVDVPYVTLTSDHVGKARTSDSDDPAKDWTAQHAGGEREDENGNALDPVALVPVQGTPGQTFTLDELPNRDVVEESGLDYDQFVSGLPVRATVDREAPRRGIPA
jgi:hypothetical protein